MMTRRQLLTGIAIGALTAPFASRLALALSAEPMPKPLGDLSALGCTAKIDTISLTSGIPATADHSDLLSKMRLALQQKLAAGADPATAQVVAVCPLCGCPLTVTASNASF